MDLDHGYSDVDTALHGEERAVHKSKAVCQSIYVPTLNYGYELCSAEFFLAIFLAAITCDNTGLFLVQVVN